MTKLTNQEKAQNHHLKVHKQIESCIVKKENFVVKAGAGAGKTKSLVDTLMFIKEKYKKKYIPKRKQIAVITFTNDAAKEINERVGEDKLFTISTIHSFAWNVLKIFKKNLIDSLQSSEETKNIIDVNYDIEESTDTIYNLGHYEVLKHFHEFIENDLFKDLLIEQYPVILIDEYQDTQTNIINAILELSNYDKSLTLGFYGDSMQRIYTTGAPQLESKLNDYNFKQINKKWNWRSSEEIVTFVNRTRALQTDPYKNVDDYISLNFEQKSVQGNNGKLPIIKIISDGTEVKSDSNTETLILEHRMAAKKQGFLKLFDLFNSDNKYKEKFNEGSIKELQAFEKPTMALHNSISEKHKSNKIMHYLRKYNELFTPREYCWYEIKEKLDELSGIYKDALGLLMNGTATIKEYYDYVRNKNLFYIAEKINFEDDFWKQVGDIQLSEYIKYQKYLKDSPFSTQHSSKGLEYKNVCVVVNQSEVRGNSLNFNQLFRIDESSQSVWNNHGLGKDTILSRTKKIFYVAVSRAMENLTIHLHVPDSKIGDAKRKMKTLFDDIAEIEVID